MSESQGNQSNSNNCDDTINNKLRESYLKEIKTIHSGVINIKYNSEYLREKINKLKEESRHLKQKIMQLENKGIKEKVEMEKLITSLKEENTILKQKYEMIKLTNDNLNKSKMQSSIEITYITNMNLKLIKDREILLSQIKELNNIINNNIAPKLKMNEKEIEEFQNMINLLKSEKIRLNEENKKKSDLIKILSRENKKLLKEIKMKYNKDISLIRSIEKIGSERNINKNIYRNMIREYNDDKNEIINRTFQKDFSHRDNRRNNLFIMK